MIYKNQRGSALIVIVTVVAVILLLILVGGISVYTKEIANLEPTSKAAYLNNAEKAIALWYRKNALRIDAPGGGVCIPITEEDLFKETMLIPEFGARMDISPCLDTHAPTVVHRNIAIWIPAKGIQDASIINPLTGSFKPSNSEVQYRLIDGHLIEAKMVAETRAMLQEIGRALELRFKAKIDGDPDRDLGINHFMAVDCNNPGADEIPCAGTLSDPYAILDQATLDTLKLAQFASVSHNMNRDSWGQYIVFNNRLEDSNSCLPEGVLDNRPPYRMMLQSITPWGTEITICPVQPVN